MASEPDDWQARVLRSLSARLLLNCCRQAGKSSVAAVLALDTALTRPRSLTLCVAPVERQSKELFRKVLEAYRTLGRPIAPETENKLEMELANGARIVALPGKEGTIRSFSGVHLLILDEASRVADDLYRAVRPMLAVSGGRLLALSTPFGKRGWWFEEWQGGGPWERVEIKAEQCPRITAEFLDEEERALGRRWFRQEYECSFEDTIGAVFQYDDIQALLSAEVKPVAFPESPQ